MYCCPLKLLLVLGTISLQSGLQHVKYMLNWIDLASYEHSTFWPEKMWLLWLYVLDHCPAAWWSVQSVLKHFLGSEQTMRCHVSCSHLTVCFCAFTLVLCICFLSCSVSCFPFIFCAPVLVNFPLSMYYVSMFYFMFFLSPEYLTTSPAPDVWLLCCNQLTCFLLSHHQCCIKAYLFHCSVPVPCIRACVHILSNVYSCLLLICFQSSCLQILCCPILLQSSYSCSHLQPFHLLCLRIGLVAWPLPGLLILGLWIISCSFFSPHIPISNTHVDLVSSVHGTLFQKCFFQICFINCNLAILFLMRLDSSEDMPA